MSEYCGNCKYNVYDYGAEVSYCRHKQATLSNHKACESYEVKPRFNCGYVSIKGRKRYDI